MNGPYLSVVIPAYNEAERIAPTLRSVLAWLGAQPYPSEVIVVDDGSSDGTADVARTFAGVKLVQSAPNRGKGHAVRVGMLRARGAWRLFMDADGSVAIDALPALLLETRFGADVAIGSRRADGADVTVPPPWYRRAWSRVANRVVRAGLLGPRNVRLPARKGVLRALARGSREGRVRLLEGIRDTQCGFKLFSAAAAEAVFARMETDGWGFDLEALALARRLGCAIAEVPVVWRDDPRSRIHPVRDAWRITIEFLRIRRAFRRDDHGTGMLVAA